MNSRYSSKDVGKRFGIQDEDLKTPGHDGLLLWVDKNSETIIYDLTEGHYYGSGKRIWESPIVRDKFVVGYWDTWMPVGFRRHEALYELEGKVESVCLDEHGVLSLIGHHYSAPSPEAVKFAEDHKKDIVDAVRWQRKSWFGIGIEIKTNIPSLGELIRQLQTYKQYTRNPSGAYGIPLIAVISPDARWRSAIESQGFAFIDPENWNP